MVLKMSTLHAASLDSQLPPDSAKPFIPTVLFRATPDSAGPVFAKPETPPPKRRRLGLLDQTSMEMEPDSPPRPNPPEPSSNRPRRQAPARFDPTLGWVLPGQCVLCPPPWNQNRFMDRGSQYEHVTRHMPGIAANLPQDALSMGQWLKLAFPARVPAVLSDKGATVLVSDKAAVLAIGPTGSKLRDLIVSLTEPPTTDAVPSFVPPRPAYYKPDTNQEMMPVPAAPGYWSYHFWSIPLPPPEVQPLPPPDVQPPQTRTVSVQVKVVKKKVSKGTQTPKPSLSSTTSSQSRKRDMTRDTHENAKRARLSHPSTSSQPSTSQQPSVSHQVKEKAASRPNKGTITAAKKVAQPMPTAKPTPTLKSMATAKATITAKTTNSNKTTLTAKTTRNSETAPKPKPRPSPEFETELKKTTKRMQKTTSKGDVYECPVQDSAGLVCRFQFRKGAGIRDVERHLSEMHVKRGLAVCLSCDKRYHSTLKKCCKTKVADDRGSVKGDLLELLSQFCPLRGGGS